MIKVTRYADGITVQGHAGYDVIGKDIVCAGVSTLIQTLIQSIQELTADKIEYEMKAGNVSIKFWCLSGEARTLINAFFIGVEMIAESYPDNVRVEKQRATELLVNS